MVGVTAAPRPTADLIRFPPGESARREAVRIVEALSDAGLTQLGPIDLSAAAEQNLFQSLRQFVTLHDEPERSGRSPRDSLPGALSRALGRLALAAVRRRGIGEGASAGRILLVATGPTHERLFAPVVEELRRRGGPSVVSIAAGEWWRRSVARDHTGWRIEHVLDRRWLRRTVVLTTRLMQWTPRAGLTDTLPAEAIRRAVAGSLPRTALSAARLETLVDRAKPRMLVAFNEVGIWGRLIPEAAHRHGIPAIDLPHAEAADPWASVGISYDAVAVYGPRAVEAIRLAGVPSDRIVPVGSVRYDGLLGLLKRDAREPTLHAPGSRKIVFASQPAREAGSALTPAVKAIAIEAAFAAALAAGPAELIIRPHPLEHDDVLRRVLPSLQGAEHVTVRVERELDLHELLREAWLLVTASSQSVLEATIANVPSITVNPKGVADPTTFAEEGLSIGTTDASSAAEAARRLLDPELREAVLHRAREALQLRVGEVDGKAAARTADLITSFLDR